MLPDNYVSNFREELLASGLVLLLLAVSSFYAVSRMFSQRESTKVTDTASDLAAVLKALTPEPEKAAVLGDAVEIKSQTEAGVSQELALSPTPDPLDTEVLFGKGGTYDYPEYKLQIDSPRLSYNLKSPQKRKFMADITLTNKIITGGLPLQIEASIIKDGAVIVSKTAMSVSQGKVLQSGESQKTEARISLIEGTDVKEILFQPLGGLPQIIHPLKQE